MLILMWIIIFTIAIAVVIVAVGVDIRLAVNVDNNFAVADMFILKNIFVMKVKLILMNGEFYLRLGNGVFRRFDYIASRKKEKKIKTVKFPKLTVYDVNIRVCVGVKDNASMETLLVGAVGLILNNLHAITSQKLDIKGYSETISPSYEDDVAKIALDMNIKLSIFKLLSYMLSGKKVKAQVVNME